MPTAILVDADFFLKRYRYTYGNVKPEKVADDLHKMCLEHLKQKDGTRQLYRILVYDCPPMSQKAQNPISHRTIDFARTPTAIWRNTFHEHLRGKRKVALRLGYLNERVARWALKDAPLERLLKGEITASTLTESDVKYVARQKGVDMKIGLDIASLALKRLVDQIILVSGDSDFVPAAKLARREGIDFVLDPVWATIREDLHEHIDGLASRLPRSHRETETKGKRTPGKQG